MPPCGEIDSKTFGFAEEADAYAHHSSGKAVGKIVIGV